MKGTRGAVRGAAAFVTAAFPWVFAVTSGGCHLADDPETTCPAGFHVEVGRCVVDKDDGPTMTISANVSKGSCDAAVTPASVTVVAGPKGLFRFKNDDSVDHVVKGLDGQTWTTAKAGAFSDFIAINKAGSWQFDVDGCPKAGTVVVQ